MNEDYSVGELRTIAADWHSGQRSGLYAFASSGTYVLGAAREAERNVELLDAGYDPGTGEDLTKVRADAAALAEYLQWHADAYSRGEDDALAAASWIIDGNTKPEAIRYVVDLLDAGDPAAEDYLPARPNLSGEWSGSLAPLGLARDITGLDDPSEDLVDALAELYEAGVADTFEPECERILRAALD